MLRRRPCVCAVLAFLLWPDGFSTAQSPDPPPAPPYRGLRYEEDYRYLRDPSHRTDVFDPVKYIPLTTDGVSYLSLGGEIRQWYEFYKNNLWGAGPQDSDGYLLQRYMLHADLHFGTPVRVFGQFLSALETGRTGGARPLDEDPGDLHQLFVDLAPDLRLGTEVTVRLGRQEMAYGSERLLSSREGPNLRRTFDGGRVILEQDGWRVDLLGAKPLLQGTAFDEPDPGQSIWGLYGTGPVRSVPGLNVDAYYLGIEREDAQFNRGTADELRHTIGTRIWGAAPPWDYNFESIFQFGRFGKSDILAWAAGSDSGYTAAFLPFRPRLGARADVISGDRSGSTLRTLNPLAPKGAYFGFINLLGPMNLIDVHPSITCVIHPGVTLSFDWAVFWRQSVDDGIYGNGLQLLRPAGGSHARYIGSQPSAQIDWWITRHLVVTLVYSHFFAGDFLKQTKPGEDVDYVAAWGKFTF